MINEIVKLITGEDIPPKIAEALEKSIKAALLTLTPTAWFGPLGEDMINGILEGLEAAKDKLKNGILDTLRFGLEKAKDAIDAHSPSALWAEEVGKPSAEGVGVGFSKGMDEAMKMARDAVSKDFLKSLQPAFQAATGSKTFNVAPTFNLGQAPAGFDAEGLMGQIDQRMLGLLFKFAEGDG